MRAAATIATLVLVAVWTATSGARADWRDPIVGASVIRPARFETGIGVLTVHAQPHSSEPGESARGMPLAGWSLPLVDRRLDPGERSASLDGWLIEAIVRIEPIYDPTLLDGPNVVIPMHVSTGTAETRDLFADHWRMTSADPNIDLEASPLASAWAPGAVPRPCSAYRVRRAHDWGEAALTAPTLADCRAIADRQAHAAVEAAPIPVAIAAPSVPVFAAPEPGSRLSSADFWAAQRARIAGIQAHLHRKWTRPAGASRRADLKGSRADP